MLYPCRHRRHTHSVLWRGQLYAHVCRVWVQVCWDWTAHTRVWSALWMMYIYNNEWQQIKSQHRINDEDEEKYGEKRRRQRKMMSPKCDRVVRRKKNGETESSSYFSHWKVVDTYTHTHPEWDKIAGLFQFSRFSKIFLLFGIWKWILSRSNCMGHSITSFIGKIYSKHTHTPMVESCGRIFFLSRLRWDGVWRGEAVKCVMWCSTPIAIIHTAIKNKRKKKRTQTHSSQTERRQNRRQIFFKLVSQFVSRRMHRHKRRNWILY